MAVQSIDDVARIMGETYGNPDPERAELATLKIAGRPEDRDRILQLERSIAERGVIHQAPAGVPLPRDWQKQQYERVMDGDATEPSLARQLDRLAIDCLIRGCEPKQSKIYHEPGVRKALDTMTSGSGSQWVPTSLSSQAVLDVDLGSPLLSTWSGVAVDMPTKTVTLPAEGAGVTVYAPSENTDTTSLITESSPTSVNVTLSAVKFAARTVESSEFFEDQSAAATEIIRRKLLNGIRDAIEDAMCNGDTTSPHQDGDASGPRTKVLGLRAKALDDATGNVDLGTMTGEALIALWFGLGDYALDDPSSRVWVASASAYQALLSLKDSQNNSLVQTVDVFGDGATIKTGRIQTLYGSRLIASKAMRDDLSQYGYYCSDYQTNNGCLINFWPKAWVYGRRKEISLEVERHAASQTVELVAVWRGDFRHALGTAVTTVLGYNV